jgi:MFS family permease
LLLVAFNDELWSGVAVVAAPSLEREQGLDHRSYALFVFALPLVLSAALDAVLSLLCDWLPRQRLRAAGLVALSASLGLVAIAPSTGWLSLGLALAGAASGLACSAAQADLIARDPAGGDVALARWVLCGAIGDLASPLLVGAVFALGGSYRGALAVLAAFFAWQALCALRAARRLSAAVAVHESVAAGEPVAVRESESEPSFPVALRAALAQRRLWLWLIGVGLCTLLDEIVLALAALHMRLDLGASDALAAGCGVALSLGATLGAALTERLLAQVPGRRLLLQSAFFCLLALPLVVAAPSPGWFTAALFLLGAGAAPHYALLEARAYAELPGRPGLVRALSQIAVVIEVLAPAALGAIARSFGLGAALGCLVLQPLGVLAVLWATRRVPTGRHG